MKLTLIFIVLFTSLITYGQDANEQLTKNIYTSTKSYKELQWRSLAPSAVLEQMRINPTPNIMLYGSVAEILPSVFDYHGPLATQTVPGRLSS